jgi:hypothetical protein
MNEGPINNGRQPDGRFGPGNKNGGRTPGARNRTTLACEVLLDKAGQKLTKLAVDKALAGDPLALRLCLERLIPVRRERPTPFQLCPISGPQDLPAAHVTVLTQVALGELTVAEGAHIGGLLDALRQAFETCALAQEVAELRAEVASIRAAAGLDHRNGESRRPS